MYNVKHNIMNTLDLVCLVHRSQFEQARSICQGIVKFSKGGPLDANQIKIGQFIVSKGRVVWIQIPSLATVLCQIFIFYRFTTNTFYAMYKVLLKNHNISQLRIQKLYLAGNWAILISHWRTAQLVRTNMTCLCQLQKNQPHKTDWHVRIQLHWSNRTGDVWHL